MTIDDRALHVGREQLTELDGGPFPLTRGQLDIWLAQETDQQGARWQLGYLLRIEGTVDPWLLEHTIRQVVREAEPLRAAFFQVDGQVFQKAVDYPDVELACYQRMGSQDPVQEAYRLAASIQRTVMPLDGPLFKFALLQTRVDEFYLFVCCHHIVADGIGLALICHRIGDVYNALASGAPIPPAYFGSLSDLIACEAEYEASTDYLDDRAYWAENLPSESEPGYRFAPASEREPYESSAPIELDPVAVAGIQKLSQELGVRRSSVLAAACALLVGGCDLENSEIVFEFPVSRRVRPEAQTVPGMITGFVPLVLKASPGSSVASFCEHVDTRLGEALQHQRFPVHTIENKRRGSTQTSNRVILNFIPTTNLANIAGARVSGTLTHTNLVDQLGLDFFSDHDRLFLGMQPGATTGGFGGAGQWLSDCDVHDVVGRLERVLVAMTADPGRRLSSVDVLGVGERVRLDELGNKAVLAGPRGVSVSIPDLFAAHVAGTPDAVAVSFGGCSVSYRQLDEASNRLAHLLVARGVGPGERVALLFSRSVDAVVAMLAVLKTGAAYLPIDPGVPDERVGFVLADAAPIAAITGTGLAERLGGYDVVVIDVDDPAVTVVVEAYPGTAPPGPAPDDVAYLIYTSGTTGVPKGVAVTHRNVTQLLGALDAGLPAPGVWALCHSLAFDVSVWEIFGALVRGGRLVVVPESVTVSPQQLHGMLVAEQVSVLTQTPSAVAALPADGLESVAVVVVGEACPVEVVDRWAPGRVMVNAYGPTETTMCVAISAPLKPGSAGSGVVPIGSPVPGAALFVLDRWLQPVPAGVVGELYVAGRGVAC